MKNYFKQILVLLFVCSGVLAQNSQKKSDDLGRIKLNVYIPEQVEAIPTIAQRQLVTKMNQITTKNGLGGSVVNPRFIIASKIDVLTKDITPTAPPMTALTLGISFYVGDGFDGVLFGSEYVEVKGVGSNKTKAYISAIRNIRSNSPIFKKLVENGKVKILEYYNSKCDFILQKAKTLTAQGKHDEAIYELTSIPEACKECYIKSMNAIGPIYQKKIDDEAKVKLQKCIGIWSHSQSVEGGQQIAEILSTINPNAKSFDKVISLYARVEKRVKELDKRELDFKLKKIEQESERIKAARDIGVAYGQNQPTHIYKRARSWW
ncbi:hypothetical protein ACFLRU_05450 [Bacteroidota bacterium]